MKRIFATLTVIVALSAVFIVACGKKEEKTKKELIMVTAPHFPPYEFIVDNKIVGIDIDIVRTVAEKIGKELNIQEVEFNPTFVHITSGWADVAASGITVTEERKKIVLFTIPYITSSQTVLVMKNNKEVNTLKDINKIFRIGCQYGTTACDFIQNKIITEDNPVLLQKYDNVETAVIDIIEGKTDAIVADRDPAQIMIKKYSDKIKMLDEPLNTEEYAIALNKKNKKLADIFNEVITDLKKSGKLNEIIEKNKTLAKSLLNGNN